MWCPVRNSFLLLGSVDFLFAKGQVKFGGLKEDSPLIRLCIVCESGTPASSSMDQEELVSIANPLNGHEGGRADLWMRHQSWGKAWASGF